MAYNCAGLHCCTGVPPMFAEMHELVLKWFPQAEASVLPRATHWLQLTNLNGLAERLDAFFAMHSIDE